LSTISALCKALLLLYIAAKYSHLFYQSDTLFSFGILVDSKQDNQLRKGRLRAKQRDIG
jgi:hypothetical protein